MNAELVKQALEKVGNPNTLVGIVSRRVRQLTVGGGAMSRPLIEAPGHMGAADVALREIIEEKVGWEMPDYPDEPLVEAPKRRKR